MRWELEAVEVSRKLAMFKLLPQCHCSIMAARKPTPAGWRPATSGPERVRARIISCRILGTYPVFHVRPRVYLIDEAAKLVMALIDNLVIVDDGILECRVGGECTIKCLNIQSRVLLYQLPLLVRHRPRARSLFTADWCHASRSLFIHKQYILLLTCQDPC